MNKILKTAASASLSTSSYETPAVTVMEVVSEGVLFMSGKSLETWGKADDFSWDQ